MTSPWIQDNDGGPDLAIDTQTIHRVISLRDAAIDRETSPQDPTWKPEEGQETWKPPLLYARTRDLAHLVTKKIVDESGQEWGPVVFHCQAVGQADMRAIRQQLPDAPPEVRSDLLVRELFRVGVVRVAGMRIPLRGPTGQILKDAKGKHRWESVSLERAQIVGRLDRMTDGFYRHFDSKEGDRVRVEIGSYIFRISTETTEHVGNS